MNVSLRVPSLRERSEDVPLLVDHFVRVYAERNQRDVSPPSRAVVERLMDYDWPGNVRQLEHTVERAVILSQEAVLPLHRFTGGGRGAVSLTPSSAERPADDGTVVLHSLDVAKAEETLIAAALARTNGNRTRAAELLGMSLRTLRDRLNAPGRTRK